ncbi:MAG TPA: hypothetical protein VKC53_02820 [Patescibacteria group bacterium]|nr:hypothetical protein [Patescibacteria group bacterium]
MTTEFDGYKQYQKEILRQIRDEADENDPVRSRVRLISFTSYSAGHGKKRSPREVSLLVIDDTYAYEVQGSEIKERKGNDHIKLDVLTNEVLGFLPLEERTVDKLLELASPKTH